ncbi:LamG-like jellyroll fold domain-containing protein [Desulfonatronum thiodismutans]|uniref:LamG-like jellyroll fold domain-containing protein n=1 Tax=Desulfonatronum thiodismutans TaxID=159290 RepID=UPI0004ABDB2A|nr:LamG-like jellyroll fold domain-containing protein [Desulfonatronum thiodismutans]
MPFRFFFSKVTFLNRLQIYQYCKLAPLVVLLLLLLLIMGCAQEGDLRTPKQKEADSSIDAAIEELTGAPTRIVWLQDTGQGTDVFAEGMDLRMMSLDTEDGKGERVLLDGPRSMAKPMFTVSGEWVIFSDRETHRVHMIRWDGTNLLDLGPGFGLTTWIDPDTGIEWLYVARGQVDKHRTLASYESMWRYPLFLPGKTERPQRYSRKARSREELVWNQTKVSEDSFQISVDGRYASTAFPWPYMGVLDRETGLWNRLGRGCWGAMSPDNDYLFWIFDGPHRNVHVFKADTRERWTININNAPGMDGYEVYHPRWSNHPQVISVTGPYKVGDGSNKIHGGGNEVKIYLGRINNDRTSVEAWVMVTDNTHADFYPDVWVQGGPIEEKTVQDVEQKKATDAFESRWPTNTNGLTYIWENAAGTHEIIDPETRSQLIFRPEPRRLARHDRNHAMLLEGGYFVDDTAGNHLARHFPMESFALELVATPSASHAWTQGRVFSVSTETGHELVVASSHGKWMVTTLDAEIVIGPVVPEIPVHLALSYTAGRLHAFMDGEQAVSEVINIDPQRWGEAAFLFGGGINDDHDWRGSLENFAFYDRALGLDEVGTNYEQIKDSLSQRSVPDLALVRARVVQASAVPNPADIAPYRRGLVVNEYEVIEVFDGELDDDRFLAAHWAILDGTLLDSAFRLPGSEHVLLLERFEDRRELEGERLAQDPDNFWLTLFFDLNQ